MCMHASAASFCALTDRSTGAVRVPAIVISPQDPRGTLLSRCALVADATNDACMSCASETRSNNDRMCRLLIYERDVTALLRIVAEEEQRDFFFFQRASLYISYFTARCLFTFLQVYFFEG